MGAKEITIHPEEILFEEGDQSNSLYYVKKGIIRVFKRKAEGNIEIDTIRAGQILGELSFLDNQPRSASAEALTRCELIEISRSALDEALTKLPEWFVALTKTISGRLRNATNKIRILKAPTTEYDVDRHGNRSKEYTFINTSELLRFLTALLAVAARHGKNTTSDGIEFSGDLLEKFAAQILQIPSAKVVSLIELFRSIDLLKGDLRLTDIHFLDQLIQFVNTQKRTLSDRGFDTLNVLAQNLAQAEPTDENLKKLNIAPSMQAANIPMNAAQELQDNGFVKSISIHSANDIQVEFDVDQVIFEYRAFWVLKALERLNEKKRKASL